MKLDTATGLIKSACWLNSPNHDLRPDDARINAIVVHAISLPPQQYGGSFIDDLFCNRLDPTADPCFAEIYSLRVSAHCLIRRNGELVQFVPINRRAWHAGQSELAGQSCVNDFSVGIELEGCDQDCFESLQYESLVRLTRLLMLHYPEITPDRIVGHSDIAPGRKTDPGPNFNWAWFKQAL